MDPGAGAHVATVAAGASVSAALGACSSARYLPDTFGQVVGAGLQGRAGEGFVFAKVPGDNRPGAPEIRLLEAGTELAACRTGTF